jgi:thioredoxin reductase (NADPH)
MITAELLRSVPLLAEVPETELGVIARRTADVRLRPNDWLIREGELPAFFIVLSGGVDVLKSVGGTDRVINHYAAGEYGGEVPLLLRAPAIASLRATEASRVARLESADFHELIVSCPKLNAEIMRTMAARISHVQQVNASTAPPPAVTLIGHRYDIACHELRDFLTRNHVPFRWHDLRDPEARAALAAEPQPDEAYPLLILADGKTRLVTPTFREVAQGVGLQTMPSNVVYDVAIIGGGPAASGRGLRRVRRPAHDLVERHAPGGQASTSSRIENYLGFPTGVSGDGLGSRALQQAKRFSVEILVGRCAEAIQTCGGQAYAVDSTAATSSERAIVIASGVQRQFDIAGADKLVGRGPTMARRAAKALRHRAATSSGRWRELRGSGRHVLRRLCAHRDAARARAFARRHDVALSDRAARDETQHPHRNGKPDRGLEGGDHLESIVIEHRNGERRREPTEAVFALIGADAETQWLPPS